MTTGDRVLLERGDDLRVGEALRCGAREGRGRLLLVEGPAGIGAAPVLPAEDCAL